MSEFNFIPISKENWEEALKLSVYENQKTYVPSPAEALAAAYIVPWDEALDPYGIYSGDKLVGLFYLSYTPDSEDNYWLGGFFIDKQFQGKGLGRKALVEILRFIKKTHISCQVVNLTVEKENKAAQTLYKSLNFSDTGRENSYGEIIYTLPVP